MVTCTSLIRKCAFAYKYICSLTKYFIRLTLLYKRVMFIRIFVVILFWCPSCNLWCRRTIRNTAFTHSSKNAWNNFWHFSASSSLIIWPAFWFAPGSKRSISKQLVLQSYNNNVFSVLSTTRSTRALAEVFARNAVPCDCFAPPGTNQIVLLRAIWLWCCYYTWTIVANHIRAFCWGSWHQVEVR